MVWVVLAIGSGLWLLAAALLMLGIGRAVRRADSAAAYAALDGELVRLIGVVVP